LRKRYVDDGLFEHIGVFETFKNPGKGAGSHRPIGMADVDLDVRLIRQQIRANLQQLCSGPGAEPEDGNFYERVATNRWQRRQVVRERPRIFTAFSGAGAAGGPQGLLIPYLYRDEARRLGYPDPYIVGVVTGPRIYRGLTERARVNYYAEITELQWLTANGIEWPLIDGTVLDMPVPPYDRIILADAEPINGVASEAELDSFYQQVAKTLYLAMTSNVLQRLEELTLDRAATDGPWMTMRALRASLEMGAVTEVATHMRAHQRLAELAAAVA